MNGSTTISLSRLQSKPIFDRPLLSSVLHRNKISLYSLMDPLFVFCLWSGLEPLLPIYQRGILYGTPNIREASAAGLGEAIALTSNKYLAGPLIIKMTGPLLRIVGDRNPANGTFHCVIGLHGS